MTQRGSLCIKAGRTQGGSATTVITPEDQNQAFPVGKRTRACDHQGCSLLPGSQAGLLVFTTPGHIRGPRPDNSVFARLLQKSSISMPFHTQSSARSKEQTINKRCPGKGRWSPLTGEKTKTQRGDLSRSQSALRSRTMSDRPKLVLLAGHTT